MFEGTIDISSAPIPALNRIFLVNDGTSSVLTDLGTTITLTGIFTNSTSESSSSGSGSGGVTHDGTTSGSPTIGVTGIRDEAVTFDGTNDQINLGTNIGAALGGDFTISVWIKNDNTGSTGAEYVFTTTDSGSNEILLKYVDSTNVLSCLTDQGASDGLTTYDFDTGTIHSTTLEENWIHAVCVFDESVGDLHIYINGQLANTDSSVSTGYSGASDTSFIGAYTSGVANWDGEIDDFAIFDTVLTSSEVLQIYNNGTSLDLVS